VGVEKYCFFLHHEKNERNKNKMQIRKGTFKVLPWEFVDYSLQTKEYFASVKHLNNMGLNP
jgi:hypothetical protein